MSQSREQSYINSDVISPALVFVLAIITCGLYVLYWYYSRYRQIEELSGSTPTGNTFLLDFLLVIVTCSLWHVYMDYRISMRFNELQEDLGLQPNDTGTLAVVLDIAGYVTGYLTGLVSLAIHQDQLNHIHRAASQRSPGAFERPAPGEGKL